jgi:hypothetical protein
MSHALPRAVSLPYDPVIRNGHPIRILEFSALAAGPALTHLPIPTQNSLVQISGASQPGHQNAALIVYTSSKEKCIVYLKHARSYQAIACYRSARVPTHTCTLQTVWP